MKNGHGNLKCSFKGWPPPRVAWYKNEKPIMDGSGGFYHTEKLSENDQESSDYILHFPAGGEKYEGLYTCFAENSIPGWSSNQSSEIEVTYLCKCLICFLILICLFSGNSIRKLWSAFRGTPLFPFGTERRKIPYHLHQSSVSRPLRLKRDETPDSLVSAISSGWSVAFRPIMQRLHQLAKLQKSVRARNNWMIEITISH